MKTYLKKFVVIMTIISVLLSAVLNAENYTTISGNDVQVVPAKNVIVLIADGQSVGVNTLLRWYNGGTPLTIDQMASGLVRTHNSDTPIADSAPAATALATGYKSHTGFIGVLPDVANLYGAKMNGEARRPIASILEASKLAGKSTGIVATSEIMHATPAAFTAHFPSRKEYDILSEQQVFQNLNVIMGGGYDFFTPAGRKDKKDLVKEFDKMGYTLVRNTKEMKAYKGDKVWGAFASKAMKYEYEKKGTQEPSLSDMTKKAIEILSKNNKGFFLMVESSKVDWAAHANDPIGLISDSMAFDEAVKVALDFAKKDGNTIVVALTDHGNSGLTIGDSSTSTGYDFVKLEEIINPLKKAKLTAEGVAGLIKGGADIKETMKNYYGVSDLTLEELETLKGKNLEYAIGPIIAKRAKIGFTTNGHTGEDVPLYSYLPNNQRMTGVFDNTDIPKYLAASIGVNLDEATKRLFMDIKDLKGVKATESGDTLKLEKGSTVVVLTKNRNIALVNGKETTLEGIVVYNGIKWYAPRQISDFLK